MCQVKLSNWSINFTHNSINELSVNYRNMSTILSEAKDSASLFPFFLFGKMNEVKKASTKKLSTRKTRKSI